MFYGDVPYMSMESDMRKSIEKGVEKGVEKGLVKGVEKLIEEGLINEITQDIINVIACNLSKALGSAILIEAILKIVLKSKVQLISSIVLKIIESKYGTIEDDELVNEVNKIKSFDKINVVIENITKLDSIEATKKYIKEFNSV